VALRYYLVTAGLDPPVHAELPNLPVAPHGLPGHATSRSPRNDDVDRRMDRAGRDPM